MSFFGRSGLVNYMVLCVLFSQAHCQILETSSSCIETYGCTSCEVCEKPVLSGCYCDIQCLDANDCCTDIYKLPYCETINGAECVSGLVRLDNGSRAGEGFVEICIFGYWRPLCGGDDRYEFSEVQAEVVCKSIGYLYANVSSVVASSYNSTLAYAADCSGNESRLIDCQIEKNFCSSFSSPIPLQAYVQCGPTVEPPIVTVSIVQPDGGDDLIVDHYSVGNNSNFTLKCSVLSSEDFHCQWMSPVEGDVPIDNNGSYYIYTFGPFIALIHNGSYGCLCTNIGGSGSDFINIDIVVSESDSSLPLTTVYLILFPGIAPAVIFGVSIVLIITCCRFKLRAHRLSKALEMNRSNGMILRGRNHHPDDFLMQSGIQLMEKIGEGQFGVVYRGLYTKGPEPIPVAIKTLTGYFTQAQAHDIIEESEKMKQFNHPNVLTLICITVDHRSAPCIVMPLMVNGSLLSYLKKERDNLSISEKSDEDRAREITKSLMTMCLQVSKGMEYLVQQKFIHRDLAARNCMVSSDGVIKVADFGLAEDVYTTQYFKLDKSTTEPALLPIKWTALEGIHDGLFTEKSDVWSFGVLCWEVYALGRTPYGGIGPREVVKMLDCGERLEKPCDITCTKDMYSLMLSCWNKSPEARPTFHEIVVSLETMIAPLAEYVKLV